MTADKQASFLEQFLKHQDDLRAFLCSIVRDRHACDDLFQEVALTLWRKFDEYDPSRSFGAWARGIAYRKVLQGFEKARKLPVPLSPEALQAVLDAYDKSETEHTAARSALIACLKNLPEKSRRLVVLRYEQSLQLAEIAELLHSTADAVHKALSRIRAALRTCVEERLAAGLEETRTCKTWTEAVNL